MADLGGEMPGPIPNGPCACRAPNCVCTPTERFLRTGGPFTPLQREWCLGQIAQVEGWKREDHERDNDADLGRSVIDAWFDCCRDKGLLP